MTVDGSRVFSQQSTVNSQRLECGIIYFLEFPYSLPCELALVDK
ncbi:hypothetical protein [Nostoc sphaeroides]|nr:hypothetical protein [Nostoc sphaeroides]